MTRCNIFVNQDLFLWNAAFTDWTGAFTYRSTHVWEWKTHVISLCGSGARSALQLMEDMVTGLYNLMCAMYMCTGVCTYGRMEVRKYRRKNVYGIHGQGIASTYGI